MKKLLMYLALATGLFAADAANDVLLSQRKADNSGNIQRNVAPTTNGFLTFDSSKIPGSTADVTYTSANGFSVNSAATTALRGITTSQYSATTDSAKFNGRKARGTATVPTVITTGDFLTRWSGWGYDGSNFIESASIGFGSTGTIAATRVPSFITFMTGTNAAPTVMTESFRVESDQSIRVPNTNTLGLQLYNTSDQVTNYERLEALWSGNVGTIRTMSAGGGTARAISLQSSAAAVTLRASGSSLGLLQFSGSVSGVAGAIGYNFNASGSSATSGTNVGLSLTPTYNQASGTAANTDLLINRTETAVGSGTQLLIDAQVGGTSRFSVSNAGVVSTASLTLSGELTLTPQALSGAGAVSTTTSSTFYTSTGGAQALTLANGRAGQIKTIVHVVDGGSGVLTPTTALGYTTITFTNAGDSVTLQYTAQGWAVIGVRGATVA